MGSKLEIQVTTDKRLIKSVMGHDVLFKASMPDEDIAVYEKGEWVPATDCQHLVCDLEGESIAIIRLYAVSNLTVDMHVHLIPEYWGKGVSNHLQPAIEKFLEENTNYCKIVIQTPQCCRQVLQAATREGFELEGILTSAILWRNKIENIVLMSKFLNLGARKVFS